MNTLVSSTNPSLWYKEIGTIESTSEDQIKEIISKAKKTQNEWKQYTIDERVAFLKEVYDLFVVNKEKLSQSLSEEMWMPIRQARDEVQYGFNYMIWYIDNAKTYLTPEASFENEKELHTVFYEPKWVVVAIAPWNYPFSMMIWTCMQAILAWNTVIFKTSKETILTWKLIEDIISESMLPKWVFNEVYGSGEVGDILTSQEWINFITFTGSTKVGKWLAVKAAEKWIGCVMELGWSAPWIVLPDADIDEVVETIYFLRYSNSGQMCDGLKRLIVHRSKYDILVKRLIDVMKIKKVWIATEETTDVWPLVSQSQLDSLLLQYQDALVKWAKILYRGDINWNLRWAYFPPTLLTNISSDMKVWKEEVFWPLLPVVIYDTIDEAIRLANDTVYGLWAYVFTKDKEIFREVASKIESWMVQLNTLNYCIPASPFWWYKSSWIGREHWKWWFHEFCNIKVTSMYK